MSAPTIAEVAPKVCKLLSTLQPAERRRAVDAALIMLGDQQPAPQLYQPPAPIATPGAPVLPAPHAAAGHSTAAAFFAHKAPDNKGEGLAVAARYREQHEQAQDHTKEQLQGVFTSARKNFDSKSFNADIKNAQRQSCLFTKGNGARGVYTLSYYGQNFIDALPDREKATQLPKPKDGRRKTAPRKPK